MIDCIVDVTNYNDVEIIWLNQHIKTSIKAETILKINNNISASIGEAEESGIFKVNNEISYKCKLVDLSSNKKLLLLKIISNREYLLEQALNYMNDGIQIYDENANVVFFNDTSKKISKIATELDVEGMHLSDFYELDENVSTVLSTLKNKAPVINRVDKFVSKTGSQIVTSNTAIPIFKDSSLIGSVVFEQNIAILESERKRLMDIEKALRFQENLSLLNKDMGYSFEDVIGTASNLTEAINIAKRVAPQRANILLVGETGTGKEIFAQSIHRESNRRARKFIAINCAAVPETLIESLLFGTVRGAFTGSIDSPGYFEEADGGTLFLDELNSMSLAMQSKILRVIQENSFRRVGGTVDLQSDVRILSSCNEDPFIAIKENRLRKDLFFRLSNVLIEIPPLREHMEDLEQLIWYRLQNLSNNFVTRITAINPEVMEAFMSYSWPGNVRELFHVVDYMRNIVEDNEIGLHHVPKYIINGITETNNMEVPRVAGEDLDLRNETLQLIMDDYESKIIKSALEKHGFNITKTAEALDIKRQSLQYRIKKYGIII